MNQRQRKKILKQNHMWIDFPLIVITVVASQFGGAAPTGEAKERKLEA